MKKLHDHQLRFEAFILNRMHMPFSWGSNDCTTFAADAVEAVTGQRHLPELRDYSTEREAIRLLADYGGVSGIATQALGAPVPVASAQIGDVVLTKAGTRDMLAICNGATCIAPGPAGLVHLSMSTATACWRVG